MIKTAGLTHIHLAVRDLQRSKAFYQTVFGMEDLHREDETTMVFLRTPGAIDTITLRQAAPDEPVGSGGGLDHFGFRLVDRDIDAALAAIVAAGGSIVERGEHAPGVPYAYAADPDGYIIEL